MGKTQVTGSSRWHKGSYTEEERNKELLFVVDTLEDNYFRHVGTVTIRMGEVFDSMDATHDIKHHGPASTARQKAKKKYPEVKGPILVMPIEEWENKYGKLSGYKRGDKVE